MTCRHGPNDPSCSSHKDYERSDAFYESQRAEETLRAENERRRREAVDAVTPDAEKFEVEDVEVVGSYLVLRVKYPSCTKCEYEGMKTMVFYGVGLKDVIKWKRIDPHFRAPTKSPSAPSLKKEAPSPVARFPGSNAGWQDAINYARFKEKL